MRYFCSVSGLKSKYIYLLPVMVTRELQYHMPYTSQTLVLLLKICMHLGFWEWELVMQWNFQTYGHNVELLLILSVIQNGIW